jgi:hypothetical protein
VVAVEVDNKDETVESAQENRRQDRGQPDIASKPERDESVHAEIILAKNSSVRKDGIAHAPVRIAGELVLEGARDWISKTRQGIAGS